MVSVLIPHSVAALLCYRYILLSQLQSGKASDQSGVCNISDEKVIDHIEHTVIDDASDDQILILC